MSALLRPAGPCSSCGFACDAGFAFCPRCGNPRAQAVATPPPEPEADRRPVTVLFADLTGFTSLSEALDPETVRAFQNALFSAMAQVIGRYDGFVEKFVGDAVMAVFGAPRAHEDDPVRALQAAQDMLREIDRLNEQWATRLRRAVTLHIGVHTGAVVAGSLGRDAGGAYAVTGDTVNTAARLLSAADPGTVLCSEATRALAAHRFEFDAPAELALKGKSQPLKVHRLARARSDDASSRGLGELGLAAPLTGREGPMRELLAAFERMRRGRAQVVTVSGQAGVGKSRLLAELLSRLQSDGHLAGTTLRRASCSSLGEPTYGCFGALFRAGYEVGSNDSMERARDKLRQGLQALGAGEDETRAVTDVLHYVLGIRQAHPRDIEPEQLQRQITLAARALVERRLSRQPLLMVIEDLQWADAASVDLMSQVADQLADRPLMLLASQRPDARGLRCLRAEAVTIELEPLAEADARTLVDRLLGDAAVDGLQAVRDLIISRAGGTPLFIEEIVRSLAGRGLLVRRGERWECARDFSALDVPPTLHGLLLSRVDALPVDARRCLQEAAVLGAQFDAPLLRDIAADPATIDASLLVLAEARLLRREGGDGRWAFAHALLHDVVYQNLLLARRTRLHARAGHALEQSLHGQPQRLAELEALGHHWSLSDDQLRGARYLMAAGDWARSVHANDDALRHHDRALATLADVAPGEDKRTLELDVRERLADLLSLRGQREEALQQYDTVMRATDRAREPPRASRVLRKTGGLYWEAGERERAGACFDEGLAVLGEDGDVVERAHLLQEMGRLAFRAGDNDTAIELARRALGELPPDAPDAPDAALVRAQASNTLGVALARLNRPAEAVKQIECSVAEAEAHGLLQAACRGYTNLAVLYASLDPRRSIETCLRGLETARKVGDLAFQSRLYANLAVAYCALTNRCEDEGIQAARTAASLDRRLGLLDHLAVPLIVLGQIHQCHGDHAQAFASYEEATELAERIGEPQLLFPCYDGLATLYLDAGRLPQAEAYLAKAREVCERAGLEPDALMVLPFLC
jgi:adenylate cyclase